MSDVMAEPHSSISQNIPSFVDAILFHASRAPNDPALGLESGLLTYAQLAEAIYSATAACERAGLRPGAIVGLILNDPVWHICIIAALYRLGVVSVSIAPDELDVLPQGTLAAVLHDAATPLPAGAGGILVDPQWFSLRATADRGERAFAAHELCRIAFSSGTTGRPKPIALSPEILWHRLTTYAFRGRFAASERIFCGPQLRSQFGFAISFSALTFGKMVCFSDNAATSIPVITSYKADLAIISVYQLSNMLDVLEQSNDRLPGLREIQAGGALISDVLLQRARARLPTEITGTYASTEAGTVALAPVERLGAARGEGAAGFVVPWASVETYDDNGRKLPTGRDGHIRQRTLGMAPVFTPSMREVVSPEWFDPGDYGRVLNNGMLIVSGRSTELINIGGNKISPDRFEQILLQCEGVRDAAVFTVDI